MTDAPDSEKERLDTEQNALKICANSTSYGIWVEVNVETRPERKSVTVHNSTGDCFTFPTDKAEMPGTYFHPLLATLITGAARLMLAIAERLATDKGLNWAFCDTDSMAFAKPDRMGANEFAEHVASIVDWFAALNPYNFGGSILKIEDVNSSLDICEPEPLYCLAISSKRYALFNLTAAGLPTMRKVSAHGLGHLSAPYDKIDAPFGFPIPHKSVLRDGTLRWHCDLWHQIVISTLAGHPDQVARDYHSTLNQPVISRYAATSPDLLRWFKSYNADRPYREQVKPFGFLFSLRAAFDVDCEALIAPANEDRRKKPSAINPITTFESDHRKAVEKAFDRNTGAHVPASSLCTYSNALAQYHISPESKFLNGDFLDRGMTRRRHIRLATVQHIGKESHDWERQAIIGMNNESTVAYGIEVGNLSQKLCAFIAEYGAAEVANSLSITRGRLALLASGAASAGMEKIAITVATLLPKAVARCAYKRSKFQSEIKLLKLAVQNEGLRATARMIDIDPSNLRRMLSSAKDLSGRNSIL